MAPADDLAQILDRHSGIERRRLQAAMAEQGLQVADVRSASEEMRRVGVASIPQGT